MRTVFKYPLWPGSPTTVWLPLGAQVIHVGSENDAPLIWAECPDGLGPTELRFVWVYRTGERIDPTKKLRHLGTTQTASGLVWHVYEEVPDATDPALVQTESAAVPR